MANINVFAIRGLSVGGASATFPATFAKATFQTLSNQSHAVPTHVLMHAGACITLQPFPLVNVHVRVIVTLEVRRRRCIDDATLVHALSSVFASALAHAGVGALVFAFAIALAIALARS